MHQAFCVGYNSIPIWKWPNHRKSFEISSCMTPFVSKIQKIDFKLLVKQCSMMSIFTGYHLIAYVRAWQNSLNTSAAQHGLCAFQFNTYIISILVIFFLQLNQQYPKLEELPASKIKCIDFVPNIDKEILKQVTRLFFEFYAKYYEMNVKVISVDVGRWQNREVDSNQTNFTPAQKRYAYSLRMYK